MKTLTLALVSISLLSFAVGVSEASADQDPTGTIRIKGEAGYSFVTGTRNLTPTDIDEESLGIEATYKIGAGSFEPGVTASRVFIASGSQVYVIGLMPVWGVSLEGLHLYGGALVGLFSLRDSTPNPLSGASGYDYITTDASRFAIGPVAGADVDIAGGVFAHASMKYAKALGPEGNSKLGALALMAGAGYRF